MTDTMTDTNPSDTNLTDWRRLLTGEDRAQMLDDIARVSLAVGLRLFPGQEWSDMDVATHSVAVKKSPVERLEFIAHLLPSLTQAMRQIESSPLTLTTTALRPVAPPVRARRVGTSALMAAIRRSPDLRTLEETITTVRPDTPENRSVRAFCDTLMRDCRAIELIAQAEDEGDAAARAALYTRRLGRVRTAAWWAEVASEKAAWTMPLTARASLRPEYASLFRAMARYRRGFRFDWDQPIVTLPQRETWRLYEAWCWVQTMEALGALGYEVVHGDCLAVREGRLAFTLAVGEPSHTTLCSPAGHTLTLTYNQAFIEARQSLSHTMQPDIALSDGRRLWLLDAKFKAYAVPGEEGDDINQMHAYRDAIVDAQGTRSTATAWCLYAGLPGTLNRAKITYGRPAEAAPVGALCLRPGDSSTTAALTTLLDGWLETARRLSPQR